MQPLTYIFDLGGSYENLTRLLDGSYLPVGIERRSFTINPFCLAPTQENTACSLFRFRQSADRIERGTA